MESIKILLLALSLIGTGQCQGQSQSGESGNGIQEDTLCGNKQALETESTTDMIFIKKVIDQINHRRVIRGWTPLRINGQLCKVAQDRANTMANSGIFLYPLGNCGETLLKGVNQVYSAEFVVRAWYEGLTAMANSSSDQNLNGTTIPDNQPNSKSSSDAYENYVGKNVEEMCVGMARSSNGDVNIAAIYYPLPYSYQDAGDDFRRSEEMAGTGARLQHNVWISTCISAIVSITALLLGYNYHVYYLMLFM